MKPPTRRPTRPRGSSLARRPWRRSGTTRPTKPLRCSASSRWSRWRATRPSILSAKAEGRRQGTFDGCAVCVGRGVRCRRRSRSAAERVLVALEAASYPHSMDESLEEAWRYVRRKRIFYALLGIWLALSLMCSSSTSPTTAVPGGSTGQAGDGIGVAIDGNRAAGDRWNFRSRVGAEEIEKYQRRRGTSQAASFEPLSLVAGRGLP